MDLPSYLLGKKSGGGGGTSDYESLTNKPSINNVTLSGNKSLSDLGIQSIIDSTHKLDADLVDDTLSANKFVSASDITNWNNKENVYYYENSRENPFVFDGKKKGIYLVSNFETKFYYKMKDDSDLKTTTLSYVSRIEIPEDYNYDPNDTSKSAGRMYRYNLNSNFDFISLTYYYELKFNTSGALTYTNPTVLGRFLTEGGQSIVGVKTFSSLPQINSYTAPTADTQFTPKKYVDDKIANAVGSINTILATLTTPSSNGGN